jgi:hypothetical protein
VRGLRVYEVRDILGEPVCTGDCHFDHFVGEGAKKDVNMDRYISCLVRQIDAPLLDDFAKPALPGGVVDESGRRLPRNSQAAHICWGRDSIHLITTTTERQRPLALDLEMT